jgi:hypothetical protein
MSPTPHYYVIMGRAAELARALGSPVGGAEHLFLGMLHDGGWPVSVISHLVDFGQAEAAVLGLLGRPGYSPPSPPPRILVREGQMQTWGARLAEEMGDSYLGLEHAFLAMIRSRETVPARALADLADLDAIEAAVIEAKNAPARAPADAVFLPADLVLDSPLTTAIVDALPEGTTFGFNQDADGRTWMCVIGPGSSAGPGSSTGPGVTREVLNTALASLGRPALDG